ncbi:MAG: hypothetical protein AAFQ80_03965 [Cyanobacteria bacterium J06621_8]
MELHQKKLLEKRSFFILPNKLKLYLRNSEGEYENYVTYEDLRGETKVFCRRNSRLLFITLILAAFSSCILLQTLLIQQGTHFIVFPLALAFFSGFLYLFLKQNYIIIETYDRRKIFFFRDNPNRYDLEKFLTQLWSYRRQYLRAKYFYINQNCDYQQQTERLSWLLEQNVITPTEYRFAQEDWIIDHTYQSH